MNIHENKNTVMLIESDDSEEKINGSITKNSLKALSIKNKTQKGKNNKVDLEMTNLLNF